jgi:DNA-binding LacI/PurR family transcriptional regulator
VQPRVRQEDIAKAADVSVSTVSRVLSGAPGISERVRSDVKRVARELGHSEVPKSARNHGMLNKALLFVSETNTTSATGSIYALAIGGLQEAAKDAGVAIRFTLRDGEGFVPGHLLAEQDLGVVFLGLDPSAEILGDLRERRIPVVLVNGLDPEMMADSVSPANFFGGRIAARYLVEMGHRNILALVSRHRWTLRRRVEGFLSGVTEFGGSQAHVTVAEVKNLNAAFAIASIEDRLDGSGALPDALFCGNDLVALAAIQALRRRGIDVPGEVSVLGFNDLPMANMSDPALTTIHVDWHQVGREAIRLLMQRKAEPDRPTIQIQTGARLIERASVQKNKN